MHRIRPLLSGLLAFFALVSPPTATVSHAGLKRCDHKGVSAGDASKVRPVATRTAAGHRLDWSTLSGCTNSNGAWADIEIVHEPQSDGSLVHGAAWCYRGRIGAWECDYASGRALRMTVMVGGKPRTLDTNIPAKISVEAARRMMQQAIDMAPTLAPTQVCDYREGSEPIRDWDGRALAEIHRDFQFPEDHPYARIDDFGGWSVEVGGNQLYFEPASPGADDFKFLCWDITISV